MTLRPRRGYDRPMTDPNAEPVTPASPDPAPAQPHGDAFLDQSGSRHGRPPEEDQEAPASGPDATDAG